MVWLKMTYPVHFVFSNHSVTIQVEDGKPIVPTEEKKEKD